MNIGLQTFRELIEDFLTSSGGRRGRAREEQRQQSGPFDGESAADDAGGDATAAGAMDDLLDDEEAEEEDDSSGGGGGLFSRGSSSKSDADEGDLLYRIEELEEELESKESALGSVQDSQQQVASQVEEVNDTVRQLLGVYDRVTDDVNPFTGEGEAQNGFGVFGEDEVGDGESAGGFGGDETPAADEPSQSTGGDETVSFGDLKGMIEDAADAESAGGQQIEFDEDDRFDRDDTRVEVQATESVDGPDERGDDSFGGSDAGDEDEDDPDDVTLTELADTFATDIIVFEWLTQLVRTGGSAATLRAISYYAEIGWIDDGVRGHLEGVLSGPDLDIHVDPGRTPEELTAEDHADSYTYIMKLQEIHETKREVGPEQAVTSGTGS